MSKAQNNHLYSILQTRIGSKILKFCYFISAFLMVSCGDTSAKKTTEAESVIEQSEPIEESLSANKTILCFGDSITAGLGLEDTNDAYPGVLQQRIDSLNLGYTVINSGVSGETTAGGRSRIDWVIKQKPSIFLLELGANDGLRGVALTETQSNLQAIIDVVKTKSPETTIVLAGMQMPPNMGLNYTTKFEALFLNLAEENDLEFIPFILKDVGGISDLNQRDGIHPNAEGHKIVANNVWDVLKPLLDYKVTSH
ncbi:arylesterase [Bizionia paragorgiae]|uniref:Acyl-CoA thioesterase-1 n=1 Tax=Bizionia paragorgiae TaxID=283786 RepID=A0A1H4D5U4_BIZPA|nr:arylesterase [Bizionia paragorgiae]SEA68094.1 acyl-CoA thioesterase-1 [Bizionia paragorgiae]